MRTAALLLAALAAAAAQDKKDGPPKPEPGTVLEFIGRAEGQVVELRPRVTGQLTRLLVRDGEEVKAGAVVAEIDPRLYQAELAAAKAKVAGAEARVRSADAVHARAKEAFDKGVVGRLETDRAAADRDAARADADLARAEMAVAELRLSWTKVAAPLDGRLGQFAATAGSLVQADGPPLVVLVRADPLRVAFDVAEHTVLTLRPRVQGGKVAAAVGFVGDEGYPHPATVDFVGPVVDPATGTVRFRATLPNPKGLHLPGSFVRVRVSPQPEK